MKKCDTVIVLIAILISKIYENLSYFDDATVILYIKCFTLQDNNHNKFVIEFEMFNSTARHQIIQPSSTLNGLSESIAKRMLQYLQEARINDEE